MIYYYFLSFLKNETLKFPEIDQQQLQFQYQMIFLPELILDPEHHHKLPLDQISPKSQIPLNLKDKLQDKDFKLLKSKWDLNWLKNFQIKNLLILMHSEELPTNLDKEGVSNSYNNDFEKNNMIKNCEIHPKRQNFYSV